MAGQAHPEEERSFSFTLKGDRALSETISAPMFQKMDAPMLLRELQDHFRVVPFYDYLKRYVYLKSGMIGSYTEVPPEEYCATVCDAFLETGTPPSLSRSASRLEERVGSWLQQSAANRGTVLLLGFGLSMPARDVNAFLTKALHEHVLDEEDPKEAVCLYCYDRGYRFSKFEQLWELYRRFAADGPDPALIAAHQPAGREASRHIIEEDTGLLTRLCALQAPSGLTSAQGRRRQTFLRLYEQAAEIVQRNHPETACGSVTAAKMEEFLCASIPRNRSGNLISEKNARLRREIAGNRLSRQRLHKLLNGALQPNRYDLMTLLFFVHVESDPREADAKTRFTAFTEAARQLLTECGYEELYPADPFDCFIMMCVLAEEPMDLYRDILEASYDDGGWEE